MRVLLFLAKGFETMEASVFVDIKEGSDMRAETDKKDKKTSVTMTHEDYNVIEEKAKQRGLKISPFLVESGKHSDEIFKDELHIADLNSVQNYAA